MSTRTPALNQPITSKISRTTNPLDESTPLQNATQAKLAADDATEATTTPEASLTYTDLNSEDEDIDTNHPTQSTLNGATFHTTHRTTKLGDGDESQSWQIRQTQRGTGHTEH